MGTLAVRSIEQKILFDEELSGQISDGNWENLNVRDHWQAWCDAEVIVDPDNVGRDFTARYDSYNFTDPDLLSVVKERMLVTVRLGLTYGPENAEALQSLFGLTAEQDAAIPTYWALPSYAGHLKMVEAMDLGEITWIARNEEIYSERDLMRDLRDLKVIKKIRRAN